MKKSRGIFCLGVLPLVAIALFWKKSKTLLIYVISAAMTSLRSRQPLATLSGEEAPSCQLPLFLSYQMDGKSCGGRVSKTFLRCTATQKLLRHSTDNGTTRSLSRSCLYSIPATLISLCRVSSQLPIQRLPLAQRELDNVHYSIF